MADDAARGALFGGAASRNVGRPNPYADGGSTPAAPAPAPPQATPALSAEDAARAALLAGGRPRQASAARAAATSKDDWGFEQPGAGGADDAGASSPAAAAAAAADAFLAGDDDGALAFDFEDLNLMEAAGMGSGLGGDGSGSSGGAGAPLDSLNFAVIDEDLARFAQDEVVREALARGVDLRLYARQVEGELRAMEALSIRDYVGQADAVAALFEQICHCESVLGGMQGMLSTFQGSLGGISREIRTLQEQSLSLSVSMSNRKTLAAKLDTFLSKVSVPEALITRIVEGAVDDAWMVDLAALADKLQYVQKGVRGEAAPPAPASGAGAGAGAGADSADGSAGTSSSSSGASASGGTLADLTVNPFSTPVGRESLPALERLRQAACEKLRAFLLRAVGDLAKPKTNTAKGQEFVLARFAPGMAFLNDFDPPAAREVRGRYAEAMSRVYEDIFRKYYAELRAGAQAPGALKADTLAEYNPQARLSAAVAVS